MTTVAQDLFGLKSTGALDRQLNSATLYLLFRSQMFCRTRSCAPALPSWASARRASFSP